MAGQSLGVGVLGGRVKRLIAKNTSVPVVARDIFLPSRGGQSEARIPIYQGESEFQDESHKLGEVVLKNLHVATARTTQHRGDVRAVQRGHPLGARDGPALGPGRGR